MAHYIINANGERVPIGGNVSDVILDLSGNRDVKLKPSGPGVRELRQYAEEINHWSEIDPDQVKLRWKGLMDLCKKHCEEEDDSNIYSDLHLSANEAIEKIKSMKAEMPKMVPQDPYKSYFDLCSRGAIGRKEFMSKFFSTEVSEEVTISIWAKTIYEKVAHEEGPVDCSVLRIPGGDTLKAVIEKLKHMNVDYAGGEIFYLIRE